MFLIKKKIDPVFHSHPCLNFNQVLLCTDWLIYTSLHNLQKDFHVNLNNTIIWIRIQSIYCYSCNACICINLHLRRKRVVIQRLQRLFTAVSLSSTSSSSKSEELYGEEQQLKISHKGRRRCTYTFMVPLDLIPKI